MQHFDPADRIDGDGKIHIVMTGLRIIEAEAIEQHEGLAIAGAADGDVALHAIGRTLLKIERGIKVEEVGDAVDEEQLVRNGQHDDGAIDFVQHDGLGFTGDHDRIVLRGLGQTECGQ